MGRLLVVVTVKIPVKIKCPSCLTYYHVSGAPVRGVAVIETTLEIDYVELNQHELNAWQRWFWACPSDACESQRLHPLSTTAPARCVGYVFALVRTVASTRIRAS